MSGGSSHVRWVKSCESCQVGHVMSGGSGQVGHVMSCQVGHVMSGGSCHVRWVMSGQVGHVMSGGSCHVRWVVVFYDTRLITRSNALFHDSSHIMFIT